MSDELKILLDKVHEGITTFDFDGKETSCIVIDEKKLRMWETSDEFGV